MKKDNLFIVFATLLQFITAILLFTFPKDTLLVAHLGIFLNLLPNKYVAAIMLLIASLLPIASIIVNPTSRWTRFTLLFPQQFFLLLSALSATNSVITHTYADGVSRPTQFILIDQLPILLATSLYMIAFSNIMVSAEKE